MIRLQIFCIQSYGDLLLHNPILYIVSWPYFLPDSTWFSLTEINNNLTLRLSRGDLLQSQTSIGSLIYICNANIVIDSIDIIGIYNVFNFHLSYISIVPLPSVASFTLNNSYVDVENYFVFLYSNAPTTYANCWFNLTNAQQIFVNNPSSQCSSSDLNVSAVFRSLNCTYNSPLNFVNSLYSAFNYLGLDDFIFENNTLLSAVWVNQWTRPFFTGGSYGPCDPLWRTTKISISNNLFLNLTPTNSLMFIPQYYTTSGGTRQFYFIGNQFINCSLNTQFVTFQALKPTIAVIANNTFINSTVQQGQLVICITAESANVTISSDIVVNSQLNNYQLITTAENLVFTGFSATNCTGLSVADLNSAIFAVQAISMNLQVASFLFSKSALKYGAAILIQQANQLVIEDLTLTNVSLYKQDMMIVQQVQSLQAKNIFMSQIVKTTTDKRTSLVFNQLNLADGQSAYSMSNILFTQSSTQFLMASQVTNLTQFGAEDIVQFLVTNVTLSQNKLRNQDNLIEIDALISNNLQLNFFNITILDNTFITGTMMQLSSNILLIRFDTSIVIGNSGSFALLQPTITDPARPLVFQINYSQFNQNDAGTDAMIRLETNSQLNVTNCNFTENFSSGRGSIVFGDFQQSYALFSNCLILRNYAYNGGVFYTSYQTTIHFSNCNIEQNFGITGGVGYVNNDGIAIFDNQTLIVNNQAINTCLLFQFNCQYATIFENMTISQNDQRSPLIDKNSILNIQGQYKHFDSRFFQSLSQYQSQIKDIVTTTTDTSISSIKGLLNIQRCEVIDNDVLLSASSVSTVIVNQTNITNIQASDKMFYSVNSEIVFVEVLMSNISFNSTTNPFFILFIDNISVFTVANSIFKGIIGALLYVSESVMQIGNESSLISISNQYQTIPIIFIDESSFIINSTLFSQIQSLNLNYLLQITTSSGSISQTSFSGFNQTLFQLSTGSYNYSQVSVSDFLVPLSSQIILLQSIVMASVDSEIYIINSQIDKMLTIGNSPVIYSSCEDIVTYNSSLYIQNSSFSNNFALGSAGVIMVENVNVFINGSQFIKNTAIGDAGVLYLGSQNQDYSVINFQIANSSFINNSAGFNGGVIAIDYYLPDITQSNLFVNNSAAYGDIIASYPVQVKSVQSETLRRLDQSSLNKTYAFVSNNSIFYQLTEPLVSGNTIPTAITIELQDQTGARIITDNTSIATLVAVDPDKVVLQKAKTVQALNGYFTFDNVIVIAEPGTSILLTVSVDSIDQTRNTNAFGNTISIPSIYFMAQMRLCIRGEHQTSDQRCIVCDDGYYQLEQNQTSCLLCPDHAQCSNGYEIVVDPGYWRKDVNHSEIYQCYFADACLQSYVPTCADGYSGNLCQDCTYFNGTYYSRGDNNQCIPCLDPSTNTGRIFGIVLLIVVFIIAVIWINHRSTHTQNVLTLYIRILTNYLQIVILVNSYQLNWMQNLKNMMVTLSFVEQSTETMVSQECFLKQHGRGINPVYMELMLATFVPLCFIAVAVLIWCLAKVFRKNINLADSIISSVIALLFILMPMVTTVGFSIFNCVNVFGDGNEYLSKNLEIQCWKGDHNFYAKAFGVPLLLTWVFGLPLLAFFIIYKKRYELNQIHNIQRFGFIYIGYDQTGFYWEIVVHFRKITIIIVNIFMINMPLIFRALTGLLLMMLYIDLLQKIKPYKDPQIDALELQMNLAAYATIYSGIYFISEQLSTSDIIIFFLIVLGFNLVFLINWCRLFFKDYYPAALRYLYKLPCCKKFFIKHKMVPVVVLEDNDQESNSQDLRIQVSPSAQQKPKHQLMISKQKSIGGFKATKDPKVIEQTQINVQRKNTKNQKSSQAEPFVSVIEGQVDLNSDTKQLPLANKGMKVLDSNSSDSSFSKFKRKDSHSQKRRVKEVIAEDNVQDYESIKSSDQSPVKHEISPSSLKKTQKSQNKGQTIINKKLNIKPVIPKIKEISVKGFILEELQSISDSIDVPSNEERKQHSLSNMNPAQPDLATHKEMEQQSIKGSSIAQDQVPSSGKSNANSCIFHTPVQNRRIKKLKRKKKHAKKADLSSSSLGHLIDISQISNDLLDE